MSPARPPSSTCYCVPTWPSRIFIRGSSAMLLLYAPSVREAPTRSHFFGKKNYFWFVYLSHENLNLAWEPVDIGAGNSRKKDRKSWNDVIVIRFMTATFQRKFVQPTWRHHCANYAAPRKLYSGGLFSSLHLDRKCGWEAKHVCRAIGRIL